MSKYETLGGHVTRGEAFSKALYHLDELRDQLSVISHLHRTEGSHVDEQLALGFAAMEQLLHRVRTQLTKMAQGKLQ